MSQQVSAYRRVPDQDTEDYQVWCLERNPDTILEIPAEHLFFDDFGENEESVWRAFMLRFPPSDPMLDRFLFEGRARNPRHARRHMPREVWVWEREWYSGVCPDEVCELAKKFGRVEVIFADAWESRLSRYDRDESPLNRHGCYLRKGTFYRGNYHSVDRERPGSKPHYVIFNPKIATRQQQRCRDYVYEVPYVTVGELVHAARALADLCHVIPLAEEFIPANYRWTSRRHEAAHFLRVAMGLFELAYGARAFWQVEAFRTLMATWKKKGPATLRAFDGSCHHYNSHHFALFTRLDKELAKRRPRKCALKPKVPAVMQRWK